MIPDQAAQVLALRALDGEWRTLDDLERRAGLDADRELAWLTVTGKAERSWRQVDGQRRLCHRIRSAYAIEGGAGGADPIQDATSSRRTE